MTAAENEHQRDIADEDKNQQPDDKNYDKRADAWEEEDQRADAEEEDQREDEAGKNND